ncbi:MAG TPA: hypothetical protein VFG68_03850 [Fimbriiglobus sp.]|nr:hypothetical protein [Fimbriiglobus sp.]
MYARIGWIIAWGVIGYLLLVGLSWLLRPLTAQPYQAFRWATEKPTAPPNLGEAVQGAVRRQRGFLTFDAIIWGLSGGVVGAALGGRALAHMGESAVVVGAVVGGVVGLVLRAALHLLGAVEANAIVITLVRKLGLPGGSALIGALIGALLGFALWKSWDLSWPLVGALVVGAPMALLFALMGWGRLRSTRP